jgi:glycosyltransferase involved in cell wall biosynthesis
MKILSDISIIPAYNCEKTISYIIPIFNAEKTIKETIYSVYSQLNKNDELILVNDGSTDGTENILTEFAKDNIFIINQKNHGVSYSRNIGAQKSTGDIIAFLDSDDILNHEIVDKVKDCFKENKDINWAFGYYNISCMNQISTIRDNNISLGIHDSIFELYNNFDDKTSNELLSTCSLYFSRTSFLKCGGFDESMISGEDTFLWLKFGLNNPKIYYLNTLSFTYNKEDAIIERNTHKIRSKNETSRILNGIELIKKTKPYNHLSLSVVNVWLYRHLKFCIRTFNYKKIIVLLKLKFLILKIKFNKWI